MADQDNQTITGNQTTPPPAGGGQTAAIPAEVLAKFTIPPAIKEKCPDLIPLIIQTESMNDEERNYWFQILPVMTPEQIEKFRQILITEKNQLTKLDQDYQAELNKLNDKHLLEWQEFERREERKKRQEAETQTKAEEDKKQENLLNQLEGRITNDQITNIQVNSNDKNPKF